MEGVEKMNLPLIEKYRPKTFDEVVGISDMARLKTMIADPASMPNMLFYGPAGTGKTTVAKIIINALKPVDYIKINGSDTTGVDTIRDKVYSFMTSMSSVKDKPKIVWIEEFDFMSQNAFAALRSMIEQYMVNARFICTCNYLRKIPEPIQSRFAPVEFKKHTPVEVMNRVRHICNEEKITVAQDVLQEIVVKGNGDIRTIINSIQRFSANPEKTISAMSLAKMGDTADEIYKLLNERKWSEIRYNIINTNPDYNKLLVDLEDKFFNSDLPLLKRAAITEIISTGLYEMSFSFDVNICFAATCSKIIKALV